MKCERCKKQEATVHLTEIRDGHKREVHLCDSCAAQQGLPGKQQFSIQELLAGITQAQFKKEQSGNEPTCPSCGLRLSHFQSSGRFGCAECYTSFKDEVLPLVEKIHDNSQHVGRTPRRVSEEIGLQKRIRELQLEQKKAIRRQNYEEAARLRDGIHELEEQLRKKSEENKKEQLKKEKDEAETAPPSKNAGGRKRSKGK